MNGWLGGWTDTFAWASGMIGGQTGCIDCGCTVSMREEGWVIAIFIYICVTSLQILFHLLVYFHS
jgi:hypothetical protein